MTRFLTSYYLMFFLLINLAIGASIGTFIENDYGSTVAREFVYNSIWYELLLIFSGVNLLAIGFKSKLYKNFPKGIFHIAFIIILIGAGLTRYYGYEGSIHIREGKKSDTIRDLETKQPSKLPFAVKLKDFQMVRYPGSSSPSEYSSYVTVIDSEKNLEFDYHIYMNHTLEYRGYKFFQTSYDVDEKGTILTVNKDPGKVTTYVGYILLFLGLILNLFDKNSRFRTLFRRINKNSIITILLLCITTLDLKASNYIENYLEEHREKSIKVSEEFSKLVVQSRMGRMKPLDTLNKEVIRKISGKETILGMNSNQVVLGMFLRQRIWKTVPMIKVKTSKLKKKIGLKTDNLATFKQFFQNGKYILEDEVEKAYKIQPSKRGTYENDLIKVDERLNIAFMVYYGSLLKIFPLIGDKNNTWLDFRKIWQFAQGEQGNKIRLTAQRFVDSGFNRDYKSLETYINDIKNYQREFGKNVIPPLKKVENEILLNKAKIFPRLTIGYLITGFLLLVLSFITLLKKSQLPKKIYFFILFIISGLFLIHTFGLGARWYISGHAPFSDTYETIIYIGYSSCLAGLLFFRKSLFALSASMIMAGIFMFAGHLGNIDPEITNLVPVLKSFWLTIHVSVITASYGFFGVSGLIGGITLILFALKKNLDVKKTINNLTDLNEISLILGLTLLVIGNFLGGVWANESWGRYW
ncbi:MAG: cytochrome c biogenesis protein ResB, partial [Campylobacterales bacterium]|nr:cytochrome c biogenesis protein ResB [Campylobacterales bacterium]